MTDSPDLEYRLPVTYVRVEGGLDEVHDPTDDSTTTTYALTITAETGADLRSLQKIPLSLGGKSDVTLQLTPDGRLTGTSLKRGAAESSVVWKSAANAAGTFAGIVGPALLAQGPIGWAALAGGAVVAGGAAVAFTRIQDRYSLLSEGVALEVPVPVPSREVVPTDLGVPQAYVDECSADAETLARYRLANAEAIERHSRMVLASIDDPGSGDFEVLRLETLLKSIGIALQGEERKFELWRQKRRIVTTISINERMMVDELPSAADLAEWLANPVQNGKAWQVLAYRGRTAVSLDLVDDPVKGEPTKAKGVNDVFSSLDVMFRPPRPAILRVWRLERLVEHQAAGPAKERFSAKEIEVRRLDVTHPGNETELSIRSQNREMLDLEFNNDGALTKVSVSSTSTAIRRAEQLDSLITSAGTAISTGKDLREAVSPMSLVDQAAERKAAQELGLLPTAEDPLAELRKQHEESRLRAQIRIADQISTSTISPVLVQFSD